MLHRIFTGTFWLTGVACATAAMAAAAQADHIRYISTTGSNANPCTLAQPCKTLQHGINKTPPRGELRILDSGDYGANGLVKKSITISGNGNTVSIVNPLTVDRVNAKVVLRGLTLEGGGSVFDGIQILAAGAVHIERCVVQGFRSGDGIYFVAANANLSITDSTVRNNGSRGLTAAGNAATLTVDNSLFQNNTAEGMTINGARAAISRTVVARNGPNGMVLVSTARVAVTQSVVAHNGFSGIDIIGGRLTIDSSVVHNNNDAGVFVRAGSTAVIANSTVVSNVNGIVNSGGTVLTRGNNTVSGNIANDVVGNLVMLSGV